MAAEDTQKHATPPAGRPRSPESVEAAALALATGMTVEDAAKAAGVHVRTLKKWRKGAKFQARVRALRADATAEAVGLLSKNQSRAVDVLVRLFDSADDHVRIKAANSVLTHRQKMAEQEEIQRQLDELREQVAKLGGKS